MGTEPGRLVRLCATSVALGSIGFGALTAVSIGDHQIAGSVLAVAVLWGAVSFITDVIIGKKPATAATDQRGVALTSVIRLGGERADVARMTISMAAKDGPTVVVTAGRPDLDDLIDPQDVRVFVAATIEDAIRDAATTIDTDAVLVTSASAIPVRTAAELAAASIGEQVGWVTGRSLVLGADGYAPDDRDQFGARLRTRARAGGAVLWESDATVVSTKLLAEHPIESGRPWGRWLRKIAGYGYRGVQTTATMSVRTSPSDASSFWPSTVARQRASVADLADATRWGTARSRLLTVGLLLRELHAIPVGVLLLSPVLVASVGSFPLDIDPLRFILVTVLLALARWVTGRWLHATKLSPRSDALNIAYAAPGSLLAVQAVASARVCGPRVRISSRALVWAAFLLTAAVALPLMQGDTISASGRLAAGLALVDLLVIWLLGLRSAVRSKWERAVWRIPVDIDVAVDGHPARTVDGSLSGLAVKISEDAVGGVSEIALKLRLNDDSLLETSATVTSRHLTTDGHEVLGLSIGLSRADRVRWSHQLLTPVVAAASIPGTTAQRVREMTSRPRPKPPVLPAVLDRLTRASVALISALAVGALVLILLGYRPLVVRSASMTPTIQIGTTVIVEQVPASDVRLGDIVTFADPEGDEETITHRVRAMSLGRQRFYFETRGDANTFSEFWDVPATSTVEREVWRVPFIGLALSKLNSHPRTGLAGLVAVIVGFVALEGIAGRSRKHEDQHEDQHEDHDFGRKRWARR